MTFKRLTDLDLKGKRVFIRSDLNVPLDEAGNISEDTRIRASMPAIELALAGGAAVMVTSHLGRPKEGELNSEESLAPIAARISELLGTKLPGGVRLVRNWVDGVDVKPGEVVLLENCRGNKGEKKDDDALAQKMAKLCDIYVNDAFGTAHRAEATTHGIAKYAPIACAGPLLVAELNALGMALHAPVHPLLAIVGGSKVSTKLPILMSLAEKVDRLIVGGAIANTFLLATGLPIGKSLVEVDLVEEARSIISMLKARDASLPIPIDVVTAKELSADATATVKRVADVEADDMILDIGPETSALYAEEVANAGTIVWNGPVGVFEFAQFSHGTATLACAIAAAKGYSIAGGGDTLAAIAKFGVTKDISYVSTGGGAFLEFLEGKVLPAVEVLEQRSGCD